LREQKESFLRKLIVAQACCLSLSIEWSRQHFEQEVEAKIRPLPVHFRHVLVDREHGLFDRWQEFVLSKEGKGVLENAGL